MKGKRIYGLTSAEIADLRAAAEYLMGSGKGALAQRIDKIADSYEAERPPKPAQKQFPFDRSHGSLWDRGSADFYYGRPRSSHYGGVGGASGPRIGVNEADAVAEYNAGYDGELRLLCGEAAEAAREVLKEEGFSFE